MPITGVLIEKTSTVSGIFTHSASLLKSQAVMCEIKLIKQLIFSARRHFSEVFQAFFQRLLIFPRVFPDSSAIRPTKAIAFLLSFSVLLWRDPNKVPVNACLFHHAKTRVLSTSFTIPTVLSQ